MSKPNFIIAGERRSGSTMLYEVLKQHSAIDMYPMSDMDFFIEKELFSPVPVDEDKIKSWESSMDIKEYFKLFPDTDKKTGQKDADLLWWSPAHKRLAEHLPQTKFIFVLRHPAKRAESQYWNEFRKGREQKHFKDAIKRLPRSDWEKLHLDYINRGRYVESLNHFYEHIDSSRVKVIILEKLFKNWEQEMRQLADFLKIDQEEAEQLKPLQSNKESVPVISPKLEKAGLSVLIRFYDRFANAIIRRVATSKHQKNILQEKFLQLGKISARERFPVKKETMDELKEYYKPHNQELEKLLNMDLKEWM